MAAVALLVACGPADITSPEPTGNQAASAPESDTASAAESKLASEPSQPAAQPAPAPKPAQAPVPSPEPDAEPKPASEPVAAVPPIRQPSRERFVEEQRLELKEQRWHVIGEPESYTGYTKRWTVEGWKQAEGAYLNGLQHGRWKTWWDNGNLRTVIEFSNGKPNGPATHWYANGQRKTEGAFVDGQFTATAKWDESGETIPPDLAPEP